MLVLQLRFPATTCATCRSMYVTSATGPPPCAIAIASPTVSVELVPSPARTPLAVVAPGSTTSRLVPRLFICASTDDFAPSPTATIVITAATPMKIPSIVSAARSLLRLIARPAATTAMLAKVHTSSTIDAARSATSAACAGAATRAGAVFSRIRDDHAGAKRHHPIRVGRHVRVVRHHDHRDALFAIELGEHLHYLGRV